MEYAFFYLSAAVLVLLTAGCAFLKSPPRLSNILIGLLTVGYALITDVVLGHQAGLFHYIDPLQSTLYMVLAAIFIYAPLNILYTLFLPEKSKWVLAYTICWIIGLTVFEYVSLLTKTLVFTGWKMFPWSFVLYILAYLWLYFFYRYLQRRIRPAADSRAGKA